ncbi:D-beta-D-heptose 7-phosphate kinase/D-beta-D-heptose 1-phosphate adenosyltransferase [Mucilaginibacter gracilis]|uniref:D-beta-D-heptose 7-phosphate kinase/D-beta-D-heptose 1-phosphate adenosyltransferase n=1 Tax=Mucilaginibacter gracilis TaxID=423350 RepID=A0A495IZY9_9SPHI|nr:bifunctional ADP-heptose synthase [Mucilaginibacter gracilis]RKR82257.1 D-beta-D-heptose 7-phosphate kinase/D-beta-D-heptose 1-phosphate adenosyltransferase [Mucilaginibacter gracilis]
MTILERLSHIRVLVIGDLMLDHYLWGDVNRISPEAPVPVVNAANDTYSAGGAANVALNLANLGVETSVLGYFADDDAGQKLKHILSDNKVKVLSTAKQSGAPTIIKTRVIVRNQQLCRIDREDLREYYQIDDAIDFEDLLEDVLSNVDAVIISDYAKGVITQKLLNKVLKRASEQSQLLVAVDPKPSRKLLFNGVGLLTPNRTEALELAGLSLPHHGEPYPLEEICRIIYDIYNPKLLVITLGAEGMAICEKGKVIQLLPTEAREVFDVSGAGDTVIATLTAAIAAKFDLGEAAWLANGAAGCVVAHMGTKPINLSELNSWINRHER